MKRKSRDESEDSLRLEYDLEALLRGAVRGKYAKRHRSGTNLVLLERDVAKVFSSERAVNEALRLVIRLGKIRRGKKTAH